MRNPFFPHHVLPRHSRRGASGKSAFDARHRKIAFKRCLKAILFLPYKNLHKNRTASAKNIGLPPKPLLRFALIARF